MSILRNPEFMPKEEKKGYRGYYPVKGDEWQQLPLPMRIGKWMPEVEAVIFDCWFSNYGVRTKVEVHPQNVFKCLFSSSEGGEQLYSISGVRFKRGYETFVSFAKWYQDSYNGTFCIVDGSGRQVGVMGGYNGYMPENVYKDDEGKWMFDCSKPQQPVEGKILHSCLV